MRNLNSYDGFELRDSKSGFWVVEYDGRVVSAMGLDGHKPGRHLASTVDVVKQYTSHRKQSESSSTVASTDSAFTSATSSSPHVLRSRTKPSTADARPSPPSTSSTPGSSDPILFPSPPSSLPARTLHLRRFATSLCFRPVTIADDLLSFVGNFAFSSSTDAVDNERIVVVARPSLEQEFVKRLRKNGWTMLPRGDEWELIDGHETKLGGLVETIWPLDLSPRTFVLTREQ